MWQSKGHKTETVKGNSDLIRYSNTQNFTSERVQLSKPQPGQEIDFFYFVTLNVPTREMFQEQINSKPSGTQTTFVLSHTFIQLCSVP